MSATDSTERSETLSAAANTCSLRRLVSTSQVFTANPQKIKCPYCGGRLRAQATAWTQRDDGTWEADELQVDCDQEPDIETDFDSWDEWANVHTAEPYLNWLPVEERLKRAINAKVNFDIPERDGANDKVERRAPSTFAPTTGSAMCPICKENPQPADRSTCHECEQELNANQECED